jgi:hypothetical protein
VSYEQSKAQEYKARTYSKQQNIHVVFEPSTYWGGMTAGKANERLITLASNSHTTISRQVLPTTRSFF